MGKTLTGSQPLKTDIDFIAKNCVAVRLRCLNRVITNIYDEAFRPLDLKVSQMNILVATAKMGTARPAQICEFLQLDVSTLSRNIDRMKARGWLEVVPDKDGRSQPFKLTARGFALLAKAIPEWKKSQDRVEQLLGAEFVRQLGEAVLQIPSELT